MADLATVPDALTILASLTRAFEVFFAILRYVIMVGGFIFATVAVMDLHASVVHAGQSSKRMFPRRHEPTTGGSLLLLAIAGLSVIVSLELTPIATTLTLISDNASFEYGAYSIGDMSEASKGDDVKEALNTLIKRCFQFVGLVAIFRGILGFKNYSQGLAKDSPALTGFGYFFAGVLCFGYEYVYYFIANIIGFDLIHFLNK